jgi:hypothetical protein
MIVGLLIIAKAFALAAAIAAVLLGGGLAEILLSYVAGGLLSLVGAVALVFVNQTKADCDAHVAAEADLAQ